ncbi:cation-transporting P-type ATPase [Sphingomonas parapaucimobilis]|uniref:cation-transporting P-type ATPase n=1 Tax=Sphingomonas parapaucimobilis TaxID=28213 RepID=UPI0032191868
MPPHPSVHGLSSEEAARRLARDGANRLPSGRRRTMVHIILDVLREPMLSLLLVGGLAYLMLGSSVEALVLLCFACLSIVLTIVQEARTERALEALRDMAAPRAMVLRDGTPDGRSCPRISWSSNRVTGWSPTPCF